MTPAGDRAFTAADLRPVDLFDGIGDEELGEWAAVAREIVIGPDELIVEHGDPPPGVVLLLEGTAVTSVPAGNREEPIGTQRAPTWVFAIPVLVEGVAAVRLRTQTECRYALIEPEDFRRFVVAHRPVLTKVLQQVAPVMGRISAVEQNQERLASLGQMAAGLAHELNNPAAAARRAAAQLTEATDVVVAALVRFVEAGIEREDAAKLIALRTEAMASMADREEPDTLEAADAEDELLGRLEAIGVTEPWRVVESLARAGVDQEWLDRLALFAGPATDAAASWVAATLAVKGLADELDESTKQLSDLVETVKTYVYMDRGGTVEVDIHEGLITTLKILKLKIKKTEIKIVKDFDTDLPKLTVRASELNQVWTNLIDNAIGALGESGTITIRTYRDGDCAVVEVADDGPGIPPEIRDRVFDTFFTTKAPGEGTGLGLATARRIIVDNHGGSIVVESKPGETAFRVWLPFERR
jgi:signal transduction histidine kinase